MKQKELEMMFEAEKVNELEWQGHCHDCKIDVTVIARLKDDGITIDGGAVYNTDSGIFLKCHDCFDKNHTLKNYREISVYSRVVGYMRPVDSWNSAKQAEFHARKNFVFDEEVENLIKTEGESHG
jgi:hypothetical protein